MGAPAKAAGGGASTLFSSSGGGGSGAKPFGAFGSAGTGAGAATAPAFGSSGGIVKQPSAEAAGGGGAFGNAFGKSNSTSITQPSTPPRINFGIGSGGSDGANAFGFSIPAKPEKAPTPQAKTVPPPPPQSQPFQSQPQQSSPLQPSPLQPSPQKSPQKQKDRAKEMQDAIASAAEDAKGAPELQCYEAFKMLLDSTRGKKEDIEMLVGAVKKICQVLRRVPAKDRPQYGKLVHNYSQQPENHQNGTPIGRLFRRFDALSKVKAASSLPGPGASKGSPSVNNPGVGSSAVAGGVNSHEAAKNLLAIAGVGTDLKSSTSAFNIGGSSSLGFGSSITSSAGSSFGGGGVGGFSFNGSGSAGNSIGGGGVGGFSFNGSGSAAKNDSAAPPSSLSFPGSGVSSSGFDKSGDAIDKNHRPSKEQRLRELFEAIDRNGDGQLARIEFIKSINTNQELVHELHELLGMPDHIRQEDGTRDVFVKALQEMDDDGSGNIDIDEFIAYLQKVADSHVIKQGGASSKKALDGKATSAFGKSFGGSGSGVAKGGGGSGGGKSVGGFGGGSSSSGGGGGKSGSSSGSKSFGGAGNGSSEVADDSSDEWEEEEAQRRMRARLEEASRRLDLGTSDNEAEDASNDVNGGSGGSGDLGSRIAELFLELQPPVLSGDSGQELRDDERRVSAAESLELLAVSPATGDMVALGSRNRLFFASARDLSEDGLAAAAAAAAASSSSTAPPAAPPSAAFVRLRLREATGLEAHLPEVARLTAIAFDARGRSLFVRGPRHLFVVRLLTDPSEASDAATADGFDADGGDVYGAYSRAPTALLLPVEGMVQGEGVMMAGPGGCGAGGAEQEQGAVQRIVDCAWHPLTCNSERGTHLVVLCADAPPRLAICRVLPGPSHSALLLPRSHWPTESMAAAGDDDEGEDDFIDDGPGGGRLFSGPRPPSQVVDLSSLKSAPSAIGFGSQHDWQLFTTLVLLESGDVHTICPLVPRGCGVRRREVLNLMDSTVEELNEAIEYRTPGQVDMYRHWEDSIIAGDDSVIDDGGNDRRTDTLTEDEEAVMELKNLRRRKEWLESTFGSPEFVQSQRLVPAASGRRDHGVSLFRGSTGGVVDATSGEARGASRRPQLQQQQQQQQQQEEQQEQSAIADRMVGANNGRRERVSWDADDNDEEKAFGDDDDDEEKAFDNDMNARFTKQLNFDEDPTRPLATWGGGRGGGGGGVTVVSRGNSSERLQGSTLGSTGWALGFGGDEDFVSEELTMIRAGVRPSRGQAADHIEAAGWDISPEAVVVNPTPLVSGLGGRTNESGDGDDNGDSSRSKARALLNVTAAPSFRHATVASLPLMAVAYSEGTVEVQLATTEVAPAWRRDLELADQRSRRWQIQVPVDSSRRGDEEDTEEAKGSAGGKVEAGAASEKVLSFVSQVPRWRKLYRELLELQLMLGGSPEESESGMLSRTFLLDALRHVSNPDQTLSRVRRDLQIELGLLPTHLRALDERGRGGGGRSDDWHDDEANESSSAAAGDRQQDAASHARDAEALCAAVANELRQSKLRTRSGAPLSPREGFAFVNFTALADLLMRHHAAQSARWQPIFKELLGRVQALHRGPLDDAADDTASAGLFGGRGRGTAPPTPRELGLGAPFDPRDRSLPRGGRALRAVLDLDPKLALRLASALGLPAAAFAAAGGGGGAASNVPELLSNGKQTLALKLLLDATAALLSDGAGGMEIFEGGGSRRRRGSGGGSGGRNARAALPAGGNPMRLGDRLDLEAFTAVCDRARALQLAKWERLFVYFFVNKPRHNAETRRRHPAATAKEYGSLARHLTRTLLEPFFRASGGGGYKDLVHDVLGLVDIGMSPSSFSSGVAGGAGGGSGGVGGGAVAGSGKDISNPWYATAAKELETKFYNILSRTVQTSGDKGVSFIELLGMGSGGEASSLKRSGAQRRSGVNGFGLLDVEKSYAKLFEQAAGDEYEDMGSDSDGDDADVRGETTTGLLLRRLNLGYSGGAAPRLAIDEWSVFPATIVVSHTAVVAHVAIHGLNRLEQDLNDTISGDSVLAPDHALAGSAAASSAAPGGGVGGEAGALSSMSLSYRMQSYLRVESDVLVAYSAVKPRALLPALVGSGLVGSGILSTPSLGRTLVCWFGNTGGGRGAANAVAVNLGMLQERFDADDRRLARYGRLAFREQRRQWPALVRESGRVRAASFSEGGGGSGTSSSSSSSSPMPGFEQVDEFFRKRVGRLGASGSGGLEEKKAEDGDWGRSWYFKHQEFRRRIQNELRNVPDVVPVPDAATDGDAVARTDEKIRRQVASFKAFQGVMTELRRGWAAEDRHKEQQSRLTKELLAELKTALAEAKGREAKEVARQKRLEALRDRSAYLGGLAEEVLSGLTTHLKGLSRAEVSYYYDLEKLRRQIKLWGRTTQLLRTTIGGQQPPVPQPSRGGGEFGGGGGDDDDDDDLGRLLRDFSADDTERIRGMVAGQQNDTQQVLEGAREHIVDLYGLVLNADATSLRNANAFPSEDSDFDENGGGGGGGGSGDGLNGFWSPPTPSSAGSSSNSRSGRRFSRGSPFGGGTPLKSPLRSPRNGTPRKSPSMSAAGILGSISMNPKMSP